MAVERKTIIDRNVNSQYEENQALPMLTKEEMDIVLELKRRNEGGKARDIAGEVDMDSRRVAAICVNDLMRIKGL